MVVAFQSAYFIVYQDKKITSPAPPGIEDVMFQKNTCLKW